MLCAVIDRIKNQIDPGKPLGVDIHDLSPEELTKFSSTPGSLKAALEALEKDHEFLSDTGVFSPDFVENWIEYKLDNEVNPMRLRPPLRVLPILRPLICSIPSLSKKPLPVLGE
jgi:glutamine synthetase